MKEEESTSVSNARLCDIANEAFALRVKFTKQKHIRKTLRSLPNGFAYKIIVIEEAKYSWKMMPIELMGSLQTFEMTLKEKKKDNKAKGITFQVESHAEET